MDDWECCSTFTPDGCYERDDWEYQTPISVEDGLECDDGEYQTLSDDPDLIYVAHDWEY